LDLSLQLVHITNKYISSLIGFVRMDFSWQYRFEALDVRCDVKSILNKA
jgi:hypothetical protein